MQGKTSQMQSCSGACHCGQVKFKIEIPNKITIHKCSCSICVKSGYLHLIVEAGRFHLSSGAKQLTEYRFHTGVARHLFCRQCGIKSFYVPRSHPQAYSVNLNCVELPPDIEVSFESFDGRHWSKNRDQL